MITRALCTALCLASLISTIAQAQASRPNIILIMADDLGAEALAAYGGISYETPTFDRLAARGLRFTNCYSQPLCTPSRVKMMTGRSNARNYVRFGHLDPKERTFGHLMQSAGYRTCIAGKWQLSGGSDQDGSHPASSGFDESCMWAYHHDLEPGPRESYTFLGETPKKTSRYWNPAIVENGKYRPTTQDDYGPDIYSDFILNFIENNKDEPFFVYYPMTLTHNPFVATPLSEDQSDSAKRRSNSANFGDMVRYTGIIVERILTKLDDLGLAENTLVIFTGDNGTYKGIVSRTADRIIPGGKSLPIDAGVHVPMMAFWKGVTEPGAVCNDLIEFSDFFFTIAELTGAKAPQDRTYDGQSFLAQIRGQEGQARESVLVHYDKNPSAEEPKFRRIRFSYDGRYKLYMDGRMFDVPNDWAEEEPMSFDSLSPELQNRRAELERSLRTLPAWTPDNSRFGDGPSDDMRKYLERYRRLIESEASDSQ